MDELSTGSLPSFNTQCSLAKYHTVKTPDPARFTLWGRADATFPYYVSHPRILLTASHEETGVKIRPSPSSVED